MSYVTCTFNGVDNTEVVWVIPGGITRIVYTDADGLLQMAAVKFDDDTGAMTVIRTATIGTNSVITA